MNKPLNFVLIGRSGSGKGTQAKLLQEKFENSVIVTTGDLFRDLASKDTDVGSRIKETLKVGGLPFDDLATMLWMHRISYTIKEYQGIICDGFPRRLLEAKNLDRFLDWLERSVNTRYLNLVISPEEASKRLLLRARKDDIREAIKNRLDYFEKRVIPVIGYYRDRGVLIDINGEQSIEAIHEEITRKINTYDKNVG